jgi:hypothetical protein
MREKAFLSYPASRVIKPLLQGPQEVSKLPDARPNKKRVSPRCGTCGRPIRVPKGWTVGPAVRKHYWAKHREIMQSPPPATR